MVPLPSLDAILPTNANSIVLMISAGHPEGVDDVSLSLYGGVLFCNILAFEMHKKLNRNGGRGKAEALKRARGLGAMAVGRRRGRMPRGNDLPSLMHRRDPTSVFVPHVVLG